MKWSLGSLAAAVLAVSPAVNACQVGFIPSDTPGVCVEKTGGETNPNWVSDEKPPEGRMPSWQRGDVKIVDAPNMALSDEKADQDKANANKEGRRKAGIR